MNFQAPLGDFQRGLLMRGPPSHQAASDLQQTIYNLAWKTKASRLSDQVPEESVAVNNTCLISAGRVDVLVGFYILR
jgi:hypothetical protein